MEFVYDDGGRKNTGFKGDAKDCVTRAISIATEKPYREVYDALNRIAKNERVGKRKKGISSSRNGVYKYTYKKYLEEELNWKWITCMRIGQGCRVHLVEEELPKGRLVVRLSKHLTAVIDGIIHDTHDPQRSTIVVKNGEKRIVNRCVYGYWIKE